MAYHKNRNLSSWYKLNNATKRRFIVLKELRCWESEDGSKPIRNDVTLVWPLSPVGPRSFLAATQWTWLHPLPWASWPSSPSPPLPRLSSSYWGGWSSTIVIFIIICVPIINTFIFVKINVLLQVFTWWHCSTNQKKSWGRPSLLFCLKVLAALLLLVRSSHGDCDEDDDDYTGWNEEDCVQESLSPGDWCRPVGSPSWPFFTWNTSAWAHYRSLNALQHTHSINIFHTPPFHTSYLLFDFFTRYSYSGNWAHRLHWSTCTHFLIHDHYMHYAEKHLYWVPSPHWSHHL